MLLLSTLLLSGMMTAFSADDDFDPLPPSEPGQKTESGDVTDRRRVDIDVKCQGEVIDHTRVVLNESKSETYEQDCDASKFMSMDASTPIQIYTFDADGTRYSINERPVGDGIIPMGIWVGETGGFTLSTTRLECDIRLVDKLMGVSHYFSDGPYEFTSQRGTFSARFELHVPIMGDVNGSEGVDAEDVKQLVDFLLGTAPSGFDCHCADLNDDGRISVADVVSFLYGIDGATKIHLQPSMLQSKD